MDLPPHDWKIVVEGYLTSGDSVLVRVNETRPYQQSFSTNDPNSNGSAADITVNVRGVDFTLTEYPLVQPSSLLYPTLYSLPPSQLRVPEQGTITLKVAYRGRVATSQTTLLEKTRIMSFAPLTNKDNPHLLDLQIDAAFPSGASFYVVQGLTESMNNGENVILPFLTDVIRVQGNGATMRVLVENRKRGIVALPKSPQRFILALKRVHQSFFDFDVALQVQLDDLNGDRSLLGRDLTEIPSNIVNGVGIFTAMSLDTLSYVP